MPASQNWQSVTFGYNTFVAIGGTSSTAAASSTDGITWVIRTMPATAAWKSVVFGNGVFTAIATGPTTTAATSTDGITWVTRTMSTSSYWQSITFNNGYFTAIATGPTTTSAYSTDGITWVTSTLPISQNWQSVGLTATYNYSFKNILGETGAIVTAPTLLVAPYVKWITLNSSATCTITLPNAGSFPNREINIKQIGISNAISASANVVPLTTTIPGTAILSGAGKYIKLISDGYYWITQQAN